MPTEIAILVSAIGAAFLLFAIGVAWAAHKTKDFRAPGATYF